MKTEIDIPFKIVYCSKIDTSGAIWISADTGLIRYKDSERTIYNSTDENSFWITVMVEFILMRITKY
jgi:ligand-binding sensor domain-containing protein